MDSTVPVDYKVKPKESEKRNKFLDVTKKPQKTMENEDDIDINCNWRSQYSLQRTGKGTGGFENKGTSGNQPNTALVRSVWILRRVLEAWGHLLSLRLPWETLY